jgi:hypothetical protein
MAFDKDAFMAAFFEQAAYGIAEKREEAKKYKEKEEQAYERNIQLIQQRDVRAKQAAALGKQALELLPEGADAQTMVRNAMASGMTGVADLVTALKQAAQDARLRPGQRLSMFDVEAAVSMPRIASVDPSLVDMSLEEFARRTYGAQGTAAPVKEEGSMVGRLFGIGAKEQAKRELRETPAFSGMSVADVNAAARQAEFNQLIPNAVMTIMDTDVFRRNDAVKFSREVQDVYDDAKTSKAAEDFAERALRRAYDKADKAVPKVELSAEQITKIETEALEVYAKAAAEKVIRSYAHNYPYAEFGFFTNDFAQKTIEDLMGMEFANSLREDYDMPAMTLTPDEESEPELPPLPTETPPPTDEPTLPPTDEPTLPPTDEPTETPTIEPVEPRPGGSRGNSKKQRDWDKKHKGKYDPITGEAIIVEPRPAEGGPVSGRGRNKKTAAQQWDVKYGDTHNPDGTPKTVEE